jgi:hypothetical protein
MRKSPELAPFDRLNWPHLQASFRSLVSDVDSEAGGWIDEEEEQGGVV